MFGELIKNKRIQKELSINALARKLDISPSYLMRLEREENKNPSIQIAIKICDVLEISYNEMLKCFSEDEDRYNDNIINNGNNVKINNIINKINKKNTYNLRDIINILQEVDNLIDIKTKEYIIACGDITYVVDITGRGFEVFNSVKEGFEELGYRNIYRSQGNIDAEIIYSVEEIIEAFEENNIGID